MRVLAVWAVLFAAYAATLGVDAVGGKRLRGRRAAPSAGGGVDRLRLRHRPRRRVRHARLRGSSTRATLRPEGLGRARAPARAAGLRLRAADRARLRARRAHRASSCSWPRSRRSAFALGALVARRIVPEPWASGAALLVGLSPPALAHATSVYPDLMAGAMLAGAVLAALRVRERPDLLSAVVGATLLALLPWLGPKFLLPAAPVAVALVRWTARRGRRTAALAAAEIMVASLVVYATINDRLYGGLVPSAVAASGAPATGADSRRRLPRADPAARGAVDRPRRRAAALGARARAERLRGVAAVALAPRPRRARLAAERGDAEVAAEPVAARLRRRSCWSQRSPRRRWRASGSRPATSWPPSRSPPPWPPGACATRRARARCWAR